MALGSGSARLIGVASIPILSRLYSPADFGVLSVYVSLVALAAPFLTLRYALALPIPRANRSALTLLSLCLLLIAGITALLLVVLWIWSPAILSALDMAPLQRWWPLIALGASGAALYELLTMWATRRRSYQIIARTQFSQSFIGESVKVALGLLAVKPLGLLLGHALSQAGGITSLASAFRGDLRPRNFRGISLRRLSQVARRYAAYPTFRLLSQVLMIFSMQAPVLLMASFFGTENAGQLGLAMMAVSLPANLLGESMAKAFYGEISAIGPRNPDRIRALTLQIVKKLLALSLPPTLVLLALGPYLFPFVLGAKWDMAGKFVSILAIYLSFQFIQKPVSYLMFLFNGQRTLLALNVQRAFITVACFWGGYAAKLGESSTLLIYSILLSAHYAFSIYIAIRRIPGRP